MPNRPFGNDFFVGTSKLDQLEQRLYVEGKQRELQKQREIAALDDEFSKNVTNIRDADVDDLTKAYQDYKLLSQAVMKEKRGVSPQQQMEILRKKADMYKLINESKAEREREEMVGKRYAIKPDDFNDDAAELLITGRSLPISKKRTYTTKDGRVVDLTNPENLLWQDKTNWQPILQKAGGALTTRGQIIKTKLPGGLETEEVSYKGGNDPLEYYTSIVGAMNTPRASQSLASRYKFTPEEAQDITIKFEALQKDPAFKNAYGEIKFPESSNLTEGTRTAKLLAMVNAINNPPTPIKKVVKDLNAVMDRQEKFKRAFQAQGFENAKALKSLGNYYSQLNQERRQQEIGGDVDEFIDGQVADADEATIFTNGQRRIKSSPLVLESFKDNYGYAPKEIMIMPNGNYRLVGEDKGFIGREITRPEYKAAIVNKILNTTTKINQIKTSNSPTTKPPSNKPKTETKTFVFPNGKTKF